MQWQTITIWAYELHPTSGGSRADTYRIEFINAMWILLSGETIINGQQMSSSAKKLNNQWVKLGRHTKVPALKVAVAQQKLFNDAFEAVKFRSPWNIKGQRDPGEIKGEQEESEFDLDPSAALNTKYLGQDLINTLDAKNTNYWFQGMGPSQSP